MPICTFCGDESRQSAAIVGNPDVVVSACTERRCRVEFAKLTVEDLPAKVGGKSRRKNRRPRQRTHVIGSRRE